MTDEIEEKLKEMIADASTMTDEIEEKLKEMIADASGENVSVTKCGGCGKSFSHATMTLLKLPPPCPHCGWTMKPVSIMELAKKKREPAKPHPWIYTDEVVMGHAKRICPDCGMETLQSTISAPCVPRPLEPDQIALLEALKSRPTRLQILAARRRRRFWTMYALGACLGIGFTFWRWQAGGLALAVLLAVLIIGWATTPRSPDWKGPG